VEALDARFAALLSPPRWNFRTTAFVLEESSGGEKKMLVNVDKTAGSFYFCIASKRGRVYPLNGGYSSVG
jgi:hypothetical protein